MFMTKNKTVKIAILSSIWEPMEGPMCFMKHNQLDTHINSKLVQII
jgi:hypothetical protein